MKSTCKCYRKKSVSLTVNKPSNLLIFPKPLYKMQFEMICSENYILFKKKYYHNREGKQISFSLINIGKKKVESPCQCVFSNTNKNFRYKFVNDKLFFFVSLQCNEFSNCQSMLNIDDYGTNYRHHLVLDETTEAPNINTWKNLLNKSKRNDVVIWVTRYLKNFQKFTENIRLYNEIDKINNKQLFRKKL